MFASIPLILESSQAQRNDQALCLSLFRQRTWSDEYHEQMNIASRNIWVDIALIPSPFTHLSPFQSNTCEVHEQKQAMEKD